MRISDWSSDVCSSDLIEARWLYRQEAVRILEEPEIGCEGVFRADQRAQAIEDRAFGGVAAEHIVERLFDVAALPAIVARVEQGAVIAIGMTISVLQIGRASCRERVCQFVSISVVAVSCKNKKKLEHTRMV